MQHSRPDLCALGDFAWDVLVRSDTELLRGGDTFGEVRLLGGGSAANVAVWARRCGATVHFVGKVGTDRLGEMARDDLETEGVSHTLATSATERTGSVAVLVDHTGERSMVSGFGADFYLLTEEVPLDVVSGSRHLHLTGWSLFNDPPRTAALAAAAAARDGGVPISFDPASYQIIAEQGPQQFIDVTATMNISVLMPNREEGEVLTGEREPDAIAAALAEIYSGATILLKLGAEGALLYEAGQTTAIDPVAGAVVDTTGAGDSFAGAFLAHSLAGATAAEAAAAASGVATWVIGRQGARPPIDDEFVAMPIARGSDPSVTGSG